MDLTTQARLEDLYRTGGIEKAVLRAVEAEQTGRGDLAVYAAQVISEFVGLTAVALAEAQDTVMRGRAGASSHALALVRDMDPKALALILLRGVLQEYGRSQHAGSDYLALGHLAKELGQLAFAELLLADLAHREPEMYGQLLYGLKKNGSKNIKHRLGVTRHWAKERDVAVLELPTKIRVALGLRLIDCLEQAGVIVVYPGQPGRPRCWDVSPVVESLREQRVAIDGLYSPPNGPCVIPPRDWTTPYDGGYHTEALRKVSPICSVRRAVNGLGDDEWAPVYRALNQLQKTAWRVNTRVLEVVSSLARMRRPLPGLEDLHTPLPDPLNEGATEDEVRAWRDATRDAYTANKLNRSKKVMTVDTLQTAREMAQYPRLYFVYFVDTRGRMYARSPALGPQGPALQKGLLEFAEGKPLTTPEAVGHFLGTGANRYGFDKTDLPGKVEWVRQNQALILAVAADPVGRVSDWSGADSPYLFLAWCFEYAAWAKNPAHAPRCPASLDGTCNGLQHLSMLLRDEVGGRATNLCISSGRNDLYTEVAKATQALALLDPDPVIRAWAQAGIERDVVKRATMTTPYGVTRSSVTKYIAQDYLAKGLGPNLPPTQVWPVANAMTSHVWAAIGAVVVKSREALEYLRAAAKHLAGDGTPLVSWRVPDGFRAWQWYEEVETQRISTHLFGRYTYVGEEPNGAVNKARSAAGLPPNFVHSLDACHMRMVIARCADAGITNLAMIHDDFGTDAASLPALSKIIREELFKLYDGADPLAMLVEDNPGLPSPPEPGTLNIAEVLKSEFAFS